MAFMLCHGPCINCGRIFSYNPNRVPSIRIDGHREAVCEPCMTRANDTRIQNGLEPHHIDSDAYAPEECP